MRLSGIALLVVACGPLLDEGDYDVAFTTQRDSCGAPAPEPAIWRMSEAGGAWSLTNTRNDFTATGREADDRLKFDTTQYQTNGAGCRLRGDYSIDLDPAGDAFGGDMQITITAECDGSMCSASFLCDGEKR
jgi:hypothetical protein